MNYGAPEEFSSDGGPQFTSTPFEVFLKTWGVKHRISSVGYPQSNGPAEAAVKTAKRIIQENTWKDGSINNDNIAKAIMQYRNTPLPNVSLSPAQILFCRELYDFTPSHPTYFQLHKDWIVTQEQQEYIAAKQNIKRAERYNTTAHEFQSLPLGTPVLIQNTSNHLQRSKKWDKTGVITEVLPAQQYHIRLDGSGSITLRNRRFLHPYHKIIDTTIIPSATYDITNSTHAPIQTTTPPTPSSPPTTTPPTTACTNTTTTTLTNTTTHTTTHQP